MPGEDTLLDAGQVAAILKVSRNTVYNLVHDGKLASHSVGRKMRFTRENVDDYIARTRGSKVPEARNSPSEANEARSDRAPGFVFCIEGADVVADLVAHYLGQAGLPVERRYMNSYRALAGMYRGDADASVIHLFDRKTGSYNIPYVQRIVPGTPLIVLHVARRRVGLLVRAGNPKGLRKWRDLLHEDVKIANRERGASDRVLLDEQLIALEAPSRPLGYGDEFSSALTCASFVASGVADACIGSERTYHQVEGLDFLPLLEEDIDLVVLKTSANERIIRFLKKALASRAFKEDIAGLPGYDSNRAGEVVYEV